MRIICLQLYKIIYFDNIPFLFLLVLLVRVAIRVPIEILSSCYTCVWVGNGFKKKRKENCVDFFSPLSLIFR